MEQKNTIPTRQTQQRKKSTNVEKRQIDFTLLLVVVLLVLFGIMMVYSSSYYVDAIRENDSTMHLRKQTSFAIIGFIAMYFASKVNYNLYKKYNFPWLFYFFTLGLVIFTMFFGKSSNGATRWLNVFGVSVQPSEFAKVAIILLMPYLIMLNPNKLKTIKGHASLLAPTFIMAAAVGKENLSTAIIIIIIGVGILFIASPKTKEFFVLGFAGVASLLAYLALSSLLGLDFRGGRFSAWLDPFSDPSDKGFQIVQSLYAVGSGGFFGLGLGKSRQKLSFIPEAHNDIIFAIICEELGFFGAMVLLSLFCVYIWRTFEISIKCKDIFPALICSGVAIMIASQVVINVAVVTNSIVNTGIPMPFISSGGTALIVAMGLTGIVLNISKSVDLS